MQLDQVEAGRWVTGQALGGRFVPRAPLPGHGASTWLADDRETGQTVLIRITTAASIPPAHRQHLEAEAELLRQVPSRHLSGPLQFGTEGELFYVAALAPEGMPLADRLSSGPLTLFETLRVLECVLEALVPMHQQGVLHRDVTPAHIVVDGPGVTSATLVDFGLSRADAVELSLAPDDLGSVRHLSPEQLGLIDRPLTPAADLYSVGTLLYGCLTARPAFDAEGLSDVFRQHLIHQPSLLQTGLAVPRALEAVLHRLLEKDPQERYQSARAVLADLRAIRSALERGEHEPAITIGRTDRRGTLTEPTFIGRTRELQALDAQLTRVGEGRPGVVLIESESGGGKSRLLDELEARARQRKLWVLRGGVDPSARAPWQFLEGIAEELARAAQHDGELGARLSRELAPWAQTLCLVLPRLEPLLNPPREEALGPEALGESRTVRALAALLDALGTPARPAVGSSRVDLQACKLEYSIVSPK